MMNKEKLTDILQKHNLWLDGKEGGERADLRYANLQDANLRCADLRCADLRYANLQDADLQDANLRCADLRCADLRYADLQDANLQYADLRHADLQYTDMQRVNLRHANMQYADLQGADLDFSVWPLWCGGLSVHIDDKQAIQLLYHTLQNVQYSKNVSAEIKDALLTAKNIDVANRFHRTELPRLEEKK